MITPKLTAVMVAVTALFSAGPLAAFAQDGNQGNEVELDIGGELEQLQLSAVETGRNLQVIEQNNEQNADNDVIIANEARSGDAEAEGGDAEAESESESEARSGDAKGKRSSSSAESESESEATAVGGDADARSGDALAVQVVRDNRIDNSVEQENEQEARISDDDEVEVDQEQEGEANVEDVLAIIAQFRDINIGNGDNGNGNGEEPLVICHVSESGQETNVNPTPGHLMHLEEGQDYVGPCDGRSEPNSAIAL